MTNIRYGFPAWVAGTTETTPRRSREGSSRSLATPLLLCLALATTPCIADDIDQDKALALRQAGRILPLEQILERARARIRNGYIIEVKLEHEDERLVYELEYLRDGEVWELYFDAATGEFLSEERD